jgi:hypothetical protein
VGPIPLRSISPTRGFKPASCYLDWNAEIWTMSGLFACSGIGAEAWASRFEFMKVDEAKKVQVMSEKWT